MGLPEVSQQRRGCFDQQVGSSATKAAKIAALMANEELQGLPRTALRLFPRYLGALLARLGKSNRNRLLAAGYSAALAAFAGTQRAALFAVHRALHALAGGFAVSCHCAPPVFRFAELLRSTAQALAFFAVVCTTTTSVL